MRSIDIIRLFSLAAIWGGSFIFLRILSPALGPVLTTNLRILIAGVALTLYFKFIKFDCEWKKNWKHYLIVGIVNTTVPFFLFAYGALYLPASYEVILNSTAPLFGVVFSWIWLNENMTLPKTLGLMIASTGVALVVNFSSATYNQDFLKGVIACLIASSCYALAGIYIKKYASHVKPMSFAACCQLIGGIILIPISLSQPLPQSLSTFIILNILGIAFLCSAIAYLLYYQLVADVGPSKALTVTFLMPVFGMIWGNIFLQEVITINMIIGALLIVSGTWLVVFRKN